MIVEYHRPKTLPEALSLLQRDGLKTLPMGGGTKLNQPSGEPFAVVDLQALGLDTLEQRGKNLVLGATLTLDALAKSELVSPLGPAFRSTIEHEANYNLRQAATVAGTLIAADGRSPFTTAMLALDAGVVFQRLDEPILEGSLGDLLPLRDERLLGGLITQVVVPTNVRLAYHYVARTPADVPIVCAAAAQWPSGRTRLALGGHGMSPILAMDGPDSAGAEVTARSAYRLAEDEWASAEYRAHLAEVLARRLVEELTQSRA